MSKNLHHCISLMKEYFFYYLVCNSMNAQSKNFYYLNEYRDKLDLEEGGFLVLKKDPENKRIKIVYKFRKFKNFVNALYQIKIN